MKQWLLDKVPPEWAIPAFLALLMCGPVGTCVGYFAGGFLSEVGRDAATDIIDDYLRATPTIGPLNEELSHFLDEALLALEKAYITGNVQGLEDYFCDEALEKIKARVGGMYVKALTRELKDFGHRQFDLSDPLNPKIMVDDEGWILNGKIRPYTSLYAFRRNAEGRWCIHWTVEEHFVPWQGTLEGEVRK